MTVLSGRELAADIRAGTAAAAAELAAAHRPPRLTVVTATDDEASAWYVRSIAAAAAKAGIGCEVEDLGPGADRGRSRAPSWPRCRRTRPCTGSS